MTGQHDSEVLASVHEAPLGVAEAGLMSKRTMRKFDEMGRTPVKEMTPGDIRARLQRDDGSGEPVGARRKVPPRHLAEAADAGGEERPRCGRVKPRTDRASALRNRGVLGFEFAVGSHLGR